MEEETFKSLDFLGFPKHKISSLGKVYNAQTGHQNKITELHRTPMVSINRNKVVKNLFIHLLVAKAFLDPPENSDLVVVHKNGTKNDNTVGNLKWGTKEERKEARGPNVVRGTPICQYSDDDVFIKKWDNVKQAANHFDISTFSIYAVLDRNQKSQGFFWRKFFEIFQDEEFKLIPFEEYEPLFVSNFGRLRNIDGVIREGYVNNKYLSTNVYLKSNHKQKTEFIHRLVIATFSTRNDILHVNHKNGSQHDNRFENLEYVSQYENSMHAIETGLANRHKVGLDKFDLEGNFLESFESFKEVKLRTGIFSASIYKAIERNGTAGGFYWKHSGTRSNNFKKPNKPPGNEVDQFDAKGNFIKTHKNYNEAGRNVGVSKTAICAAIKRQGTSGGFYWKLHLEEESENEEESEFQNEEESENVNEFQNENKN